MVKRPRDLNQLAKLVVYIATAEAQDDASELKRHPQRRGRSGGVKGGSARAERLTPERRSEIAKAAADARWNK